jgi:hypothetical protein
MRPYFSSYHLWAAEHYAWLAKEIEDTHTGEPRFDITHRAYVTSTVISAVAFLEAVINELFDDVADRQRGFIDSIPPEAVRLLAGLWGKDELRSVERWPILDKFGAALLCCGAAPFDRGSRAYQDVKLLISLRDNLVHARPETRTPGDLDKLSTGLINKFEPNRLMNGATNPYFPDHCLGAGCAIWTTKSARTFADDFFGRVKLTPNYQNVDFG